MSDKTFKTDQQAKHQIIAQERLYLTKDRSRVVKEGDKDAATLLAAVGQPIPMAEAKRLGLVTEPSPVPSVPAPATTHGVDPVTRSTRPVEPPHKR